MVATRDKKTALWLAAESTYGVDPDATGAAYLPCRAENLELLKDDLALLETSDNTGANRPTAMVVGPDGATIQFERPAQGLSLAAGAAGTVPAVDDLDLILANAFGLSSNVGGLTVTSATSSGLVLPSAGLAEQDLAVVQLAALNGGKAQWRRVGGAGPTYTLDRNWDVNPNSSAVQYGARNYRPNDIGGGASLTAYFMLDDTPYVLSGGRVTSLVLDMQAKQMARWQVQMAFDSKTQATRASVPPITLFSGAPIKGMLGGLWWGGASYHTKGIKLDFKTRTTDAESVLSTNGRANKEVMDAFAEISIEPPWAGAFETDFRAGTVRSLMIQYGPGILAGGVLNTCAFFAEAAQVKAANASKDGGRIRQQVNLGVVNAGIFSGSTLSHFWTYARA